MAAAPFNILLVGCGKMGGAMLRRWTDLRLGKDIKVIEPNDPRHLPSPAALPADFKPDVIVFAVKPQSLPALTAAYKKFTGALVLSIAAGKPVSFFEKELGINAKVVRVMPNTPAAIGKGISAAYANKNVSPEDKSRADALLSAVGEAIWLDNEGQLDAVTALSGSGPAYVFLLIEMLEKAGAQIGLPPDMARRLARKTVEGSAALAEASPNIPAAQLRQDVTSPGGTTAAALGVLMTPEVQKIYDAALAAAAKRAEELARDSAP